MTKNLDIKILETANEGPDNPFALFDNWFVEAEASEPIDHNAMCLATCNAQGEPSARIVLLKAHDERGFVFYTNTESKKGNELAENPKAALNFYWKSMNRQIRIEGHIKPVSNEEADAYFASRHKGSRIGAWASRQSESLKNRTELEDRVKTLEEQYQDEEDIPRPPHWSGYRLIPNRIEFWHEGAFRLHTRLSYKKNNSSWDKTMLSP